MLSYDELKKYFDNYIENTYIYIEEKFLYLSDENDIKRYNKRNEMIKQKYDHTMRVVENISKLALKIGQSINFLELTKTVALLHDIGRFEQAKRFDTYVDSIVYKNHPTLKNHGEEGEKYLKEKGFLEFGVNKIYQPAIAKSVGLHQNNQLPNDLNQRVNYNFIKLNPNNILTGSYSFNDIEQKIISLLLQMIRDIDKIDILYQRANGEIKSVPKIIDVKNVGQNNIMRIWGVTIEDLKELNTMDELINADRLKIYSEKIPVEKLFVKDEIKNMIYKKENISLKDLQNRDDYSFITALWWSIYTFLSDINFVSNLDVIEENNLLDKIYNQYPEKYRMVIDEIFLYAKEILINEQKYLNKDNLYVNKIR